MHVTDVRKAVADIKVLCGDPEAAHGAEDALWEQVLEAIAIGECEDPAACATEALSTKNYNFARWTA